MAKQQFAAFWNGATLSDSRPPQPRDYLYASELGSGLYDTIKSMRGETPTTPANDRSRRKFFAGHVWEYIVKNVLLMCGLYQKEEITVNSVPFDGLLGVHGRLDFLVGGKVDKETAMRNVEQNGLPDFLKAVAERIIAESDGYEYEKMILEVKSCSMFVLDYVEKRNAPISSHAMQAYHYKRTTGLPADIIYVSKDTALIKQFSLKGVDLENQYRNILEKATYYYNSGKMPPLEPILGFDESVAQFKKNLQVEYSKWLTDYGYTNPDEYRRAVEPTVKRWNSVLSRYAKAEAGGLTPTGKVMVISPKNKEVRQEIINAGYDFDGLLRLKMELLSVDGEEIEED